jgi:hypothetical protein
MPELPKPPAPYAQCVDWLFAHMEDSAGGPPAPLPRTFAPPRAPAPPGSTQPPPTLESPTDLRAAQDWFQAERRNLEEYTRQQFGLIEQQHYAVLTRHYQTEADIARRAQEINREMQFLAAQAEAMKERARGLAEWEAALTEQTERLARLQDEHAVGQPEGEQAERARLASLEALRAATSQRQLSEAAARAKFEATQALIHERQAVWEKKQAEFLARQEQLERRYRDLDKAEESLRRRSVEMDEVEERLLQTIEEAEADCPRPAPHGRTRPARACPNGVANANGHLR